ncbi:MAG: 50S ribosomal protein L17 [Patescibacteria group bacterium]|nr:50S ribosomal protein L17 [Patescibacteria group bacterium]
MNHHVYGKKLSRSTDERKQLRRNLMKSLILHGGIQTTRAKAKAIQADLEKLITKAKKDTDAMRREILAVLGDKKTTKQLMEIANIRCSGRTSGYTRMVKLGPRQGDSSEMVMLSFVDEKIETEIIDDRKKTKKKNKKEEEIKQKKTDNKKIKIKKI